MAFNALVRRAGERADRQHRPLRGGLERGRVGPLSRGAGLLPSSEAEVKRAVEGLGGEASSEAEIAPRARGGPQMGRTTELGRGPSANWASLSSGEDFGHC